MTSAFRAFDPGCDRDIDLLTALYAATRAEPFPRARVEEILHRTVRLGFRALIAADGSAYARTFHQPWFEDGLFGVHVLVHPEVRRRGTGTRLLSEITETARSIGGTAQIGSVPDANSEGLDFALRHGFTVERHMSASSLVPSAVAQELITVPPPDGIEIATLVALGDTEANGRRVWEVTERTAQDFPNERRKPRTYEQFRDQFFEAAWFRPAGQFIARDGDVWAGVATVGFSEARNVLYHHMTGVERAYRGRGIATALKRATIAYALDIGAAALETNNDSSNAPMLAVNRSFGYVDAPGHTDVRRSLGNFGDR